MIFGFKVADYCSERGIGSRPSLEHLRMLVEIAARAGIQCRDRTFDTSFLDELPLNPLELTPTILELVEDFD